MRFALIFSIFSLTSLYASNNRGHIFIDVINKNFDGKKFADKGYNVRREFKKFDMVVPYIRDKAIVGSEIDITEYDELDRDVLYIRARESSLEELIHKYPKIKEDSLKRLMQLVKVDKK